MKNVNSIWEKVVLCSIILTALEIAGALNGYFFKVNCTILLLFIAYLLKEILLYLKQK